MRISALVIFLLICSSSDFFVRSQEIYNNCNTAFELCPGQTYSLNNLNANVTFCPNCEDDFAFCFTPQNSIWMTFTTNASGGDVQVDFSNLVFQTDPGRDNELQATIIQAVVPCDGSTYTQLGNCQSNETGNFSLNVVGLPATTTYYIVVDGDDNGVGITDPAECTFDVSVSGTGIDRAASGISITPTDATICLYEKASFAATITDCPDNGDYLWYINGNLAATTTAPTFQTTELQDGDIVSVETSCYSQCSQVVTSATNALTVISFPIDAGPSQTISAGESVVLAGSTTADTFSWTPSFLVSNDQILNPITAPTETTVYTLTATQNGCILTDQTTVTVGQELEIPNSFSPNGDLINDTWVINGIEEYPNAKIQIFTRWGQEVFLSIGYNVAKAWNGTSKNGKPLAEGVYYYVIELDGETEQLLKGHISMIR